MTEYTYTTQDLADEFGIDKKTLRAKAAPLGIGINWGGRAGYRYSAADRQRLIDSLKPDAPLPRKRRRAA